MPTRYLITIGATTTAGGKITSGSAFASIDGAAVALEGDLCLCKCAPPPRLVAAQRLEWQEIDAP